MQGASNSPLRVINIYGGIFMNKKPDETLGDVLGDEEGQKGQPPAEPEKLKETENPKPPASGPVTPAAEPPKQEAKPEPEPAKVIPVLNKKFPFQDIAENGEHFFIQGNDKFDHTEKFVGKTELKLEEGKKPFNCGICGENFATQKDLIDHIKKTH
jgi:hypothetical protein